MSYFPSGGAASGWTAIETVTISDVATVEMDLSGAFKMYRLHLDNIVPATDDRELWMRWSTDGGSTFLEGATDYSLNMFGVSEQSTISNGDVDSPKILLTKFTFPTLLGNGTAESFNGIVNIHNPNQTTKAICMSSQMGCLDSASFIAGLNNRGELHNNIDEIDAVQILVESGNLTSGRITLYGLGLS
jgi:hypothetical protein